MLKSIDLSTSGLVAQRQRLNTVAGNIANAGSTRDAEGNVRPYQRRFVQFSAAERPGQEVSGGVGVTYEVLVDQDAPPRRVHEPAHPDADGEGYVSYPDINPVTEFVNALEASRAYEANVVAIEVAKDMAERTLSILV